MGFKTSDTQLKRPIPNWYERSSVSMHYALSSDMLPGTIEDWIKYAWPEMEADRSLHIKQLWNNLKVMIS